MQFNEDISCQNFHETFPKPRQNLDTESKLLGVQKAGLSMWKRGIAKIVVNVYDKILKR